MPPRGPAAGAPPTFDCSLAAEQLRQLQGAAAKRIDGHQQQLGEGERQLEEARGCWGRRQRNPEEGGQPAGLSGVSSVVIQTKRYEVQADRTD